ncbi:MAG TPA: cytochrome c [Acidimicrobiia bacterium]|nr:cytochrome c [Acidimicrobiia bacterium]
MTVWTAVLAAFAAAACGGSPEPTAAPEPTGAQANDAVLHVGRDVYVRSCAPCHGLSGQGASGPRLAGDVTERYPDPADQRAVVASGRGVMPGFSGELSDAELDAIVRYTREVL